MSELKRWPKCSISRCESRSSAASIDADRAALKTVWETSQREATTESGENCLLTLSFERVGYGGEVSKARRVSSSPDKEMSRTP
jgi:hypothetical protein